MLLEFFQKEVKSLLALIFNPLFLFCTLHTAKADGFVSYGGQGGVSIHHIDVVGVISPVAAADHIVFSSISTKQRCVFSTRYSGYDYFLACDFLRFFSAAKSR
jgi:hypothetical protein